MAVNTNFQIPFLPQEGVTQQVLAAIQLANAHNQAQAQLQLQRQAQPSEIGLREAQTGLAGAQTQDILQQAEQRKVQLDLQKRMFGYVFGNPDVAQTPTSGAKPNTFADDMASTKARLELNPEESAAYDAAVKQIQVGMLSGKGLDTKPIEQVIQAHLSRVEKAQNTLTKFRQHEGTDPTTGWFEEARTSDGKLAFRVPAPPPAEYLPSTTTGTDIIRTTDAQTGQVTATPFETSKTTSKSMGGAPAAAAAPTPGAPKAGKPIAVAGGGRKLTEQGQSLVTGLSQASDLMDNAMKFLDKPPSYVDWQKANLQYKVGADPGPGFTNAFQAIGLLRAVATGPLLHGIRNQAIIKGIQEHLPSLWDSPSLVKQKLTDLKPFWQQAIKEVYKTESVAQPGGAISDEAAQYLKSQGIAVPQ